MFTEFSGCGLSSNQHTWITPNSIVTSLREIGAVEILIFLIKTWLLINSSATQYSMDILIPWNIILKLRRTEELWWSIIIILDYAKKID